MPLAEDLDARRADVGDRGHRGLEVEDRAVVAHEAVEADAVAEGSPGRLGREGDVAGHSVRRRLVLDGDVRHPQSELDGHLVDAVGKTTGVGDGDDRRLLKGPADAIGGPQLGERVAPALQGPHRDVGGDVDQVAHSNGNAVDERRRHAPVRRHPEAELEAGDLAAVPDIAEAGGLEDVSFEKHLCSLSVRVRRRTAGHAARAGPRQARSERSTFTSISNISGADFARRGIRPLDDAPATNRSDG